MRHLKDTLCWLAIAAGAGVWWQPDPAFLRAGTIHVAAHGRDWYPGHRAEWPLRSLQRAADVARPGDTIVVQPETYHGPVRIHRGGTAAAPVTLRAAIPGSVRLTLAASAERVRELVWRDEGEGVFSAPVPWPVYRVRGDGLAYWSQRQGGTRRLRSVVVRGRGAAQTPTESADGNVSMPQAPVGPLGAFLTDAGRLHLAPPDGRMPRQLEMNRRVLAPGLWGVHRAANLLVEAGHLRIEGLCFDFGVGSGIRVEDAGDVIVRDCMFTGAETGVSASGIAAGLLVERCYYHNFPQANWVSAGLTPTEVYGASSACLVAPGRGGATVAGNLVAHATDGIGARSAGGGFAWVVSNVVFRVTDDAFECDGMGVQVTIRHNLVYDTHESLGLSPVLAGPVLVAGNLFLHPAGGLNGAQVKLINPWKDRTDVLGGIIRNITIEDNTFVGEWLCWFDQDRPVENVIVRRNLFAVERAGEPPWPAGVTETQNLHLAADAFDRVRPGRHGRWFEEHAGGAASEDGRWRVDRPGPAWLDWEADVVLHEILAALPGVWEEP